MDDPRRHLTTVDEIEQDCMPSLVEVLRTEGIEGARYALWDATGWHRDYDPCIWRSRATDERKRIGWEMWVRGWRRSSPPSCTRRTRGRSWKLRTHALEEGPEGFYKSHLDR